MIPCDVPLNLLQGLYIIVLLIMIPLRTFMNTRSRTANSTWLHDLFSYITLVHFILCTVIFITYTIYLIGGDYGFSTCTSAPLRMLPYNDMFIWLTTMGPGLVLVVTAGLIVVCCPCIAYYGIKYLH